MSFLSLIHHPDPDRRARFTRRALALAAECGPLRVTRAFAFGPVAGVVATPHAELLTIDTKPERLRMRLGPMSAHRLSAEAADRWPDGFEPTRDAYPGGFFAALAVRACGSLAVGADRWGLYPLYVSRLPDGAWLVASSPAFMAADSAYHASYDVAGLCGLLLVNGLVDNRSVFANVSRLPAGRILCIDPAGAHRISAEPMLPEDTGWSGLSKIEALERLGELWPMVLRRLYPDEPSLIFLSGGIDSRMIAGGLGRLGLTTTGYTMGAPGDYECIAGRAVARASGLPWVGARGDPPARDELERMRWLARWSGLSGGFSGGCAWTPCPEPLRDTVFAWTGMVLDELLGGKAINFLAASGPTGKAAFFLERMNAWGIAPERLSAMLRDPRQKDLPAAVCDAFVQAFSVPGESEYTASIKAKLENRSRFHLGNLLWMTSFRHWPIIPALEPEILEAAFHLDPDVLAQRFLQRAFLLRFHPETCPIPVDQNDHTFRTVDGKRRRRFSFPRFRDPRRYHRIFNPNYAAWRLIRKETEPYRHLLGDGFDLDALASIWPPAEQRWGFSDPFGEPAGGRNLMGIAWRRAMEEGGLSC